MKNLIEENKAEHFESFEISSKLGEFNDGRCDDRRRSAKRTIPTLSQRTVSGSRSANISSEKRGSFIKKNKISFKIIMSSVKKNTQAIGYD